MRRNERERLARCKAYKQEQALRSALRMGEPNRCFKNSMTAVFACPERLRYVEGFVIHECECGCRSPFIHHAWVVDNVTGQRHEVTPHHENNDKYVGKEFEKDKLINPFVVEDDGTPVLIESPDWWEPQLSLQEQLDILTAAGYDVELRTKRWNEAARETDDWGDVLDISAIDLSDRCAGYALEEECGDGWEYEWWLKDAHTMVAEAMMA